MTYDPLEQMVPSAARVKSDKLNSVLSKFPATFLAVIDEEIDAPDAFFLDDLTSHTF